VPNRKWSQPPIEIDPNAQVPTYCGWDQTSLTIDPCNYWGAVADDFRCLGTMPVSSVHWWGSHSGWSEPYPPPTQPTSWRIGFWSNIPAGPQADPNYSRPDILLWQVEVDADRVTRQWVGDDWFPDMMIPEACFQYYVQFEPDEYFRQADFEADTQDNVFWISIVAIYPPPGSGPCPWGWKTRPWPWMDDAVAFGHWGPLEPGAEVDPDLVAPIERDANSYDVAFELDTDPNYVKWEQPFTGIRHWPHYEDMLSMAGPVTETKWQQLPDPNGWDVELGRYVGDDWLCQQTGPVSHIGFWFSWEGDIVGQISFFELSICSDDPAGPGGSDPCNTFSKPGALLWYWHFRPGDYTVSLPWQGSQGWFDPVAGDVKRPDHNNFYRIDLDVEDITEPFIQQEGNIYWLRIVGTTTGAAFGWKTSLDHWNDNAVYQDGSGQWQGLYDPCTGGILDMAFEITTRKDCEVYAQVADDWRCRRRTPVTAAVWWGSYLGYEYQPCEVAHMPAPVEPNAFLLSIWTDVPAGGQDEDYSRPGEMIWQYRADDYDQVLVGYDKHPEDPNRLGIEPVFRYSVRLPEDDWFFQRDVNGIYWFSVLAVYDGNAPNYDWGWTNHKHMFNDNAVTGTLQPGTTDEWIWDKIHDQTGAPADMSFVLFTDPNECTNCADYNTDSIVNFPDYAEFADGWQWTGPAGGYHNSDLNCDGLVDFADVKILADQWLDSCP
jgi:hypothetical protein